MSWLKGPRESREFGENGDFGENGELGEILPKCLTKANELAQRAPWKAAILAKVANLAKICHRFDKGNDLGRRALLKATNLVKAANLAKICQSV